MDIGSFMIFWGREIMLYKKKMSWRNGTSALVHQCDTHIRVAVASNFAPPCHFYEAGPNFGLPFSVVANLRTRFQNFHGARPFTPPCTENRVDDVSSEAGTKSTTFQRKRGALQCCSMPFHICLAVGTSHQVLSSETEARQERWTFATCGTS